MHIDWASLAAVAIVAAAAALTVVLLVAFTVVALSSHSHPEGEGPAGVPASGTRPGAGTTVAVLCVLAAGLVVCCGLYLIVA